jgi:hypothetical protein
MEERAKIQINIARYRCLLRGPLDATMRRVLSEMLSEEEARLAQSTAESRAWNASSPEDAPSPEDMAR